MNEGAAFFCDISAAIFFDAFDAEVSGLGYTLAGEPAKIEARAWTFGDRGCAGISLSKSLALALAAKLARKLSRDVRVLTASLVTGKKDDFECLVDDLTVSAKGGTPKVGRWGADMVHLYGENWDDVCDGKSYFAVSALLDEAADHVLGADAPHAKSERRYALAAPASLGSARLDAIATQIRLAERVELTRMGGRECIRATTNGTTLTSFLEPSDADTLRLHGLIAMERREPRS